MRIRKQSAKKYVWHICDRIFHFKKYCQSIVKDDVKFVNRRFSFSCFVLFTLCVCRSLDIGEKRRTLKSPWRENFLFCFATWLKGFGSRTEGEWPLVMIEDFPELRAQFCLRLWRENQWDGVGRTTQSTARQNVVFNNNNICNNYERESWLWLHRVASLLAFHLLKFHQFSKWPTRRSLQ